MNEREPDYLRNCPFNPFPSNAFRDVSGKDPRSCLKGGCKWFEDCPGGKVLMKEGEEPRYPWYDPRAGKAQKLDRSPHI